MVVLKYGELTNFGFAQAIQKISSTPTHGEAASRIHKVVKAVSRAKDKVVKEYQDEIVEKFGKRDEAGKLIRPEGGLSFEPDETRQEEFLKAQEEFGHKTMELGNLSRFTIQTLEGIKVSAQDLEALKDLWVGNVEGDTSAEKGPGVPTNVASLR